MKDIIRELRIINEKLKVIEEESNKKRNEANDLYDEAFSLLETIEENYEDILIISKNLDENLRRIK